MDNFIWILWAIFGVLLIIAEIFTLGFVLFWFGLGALAAGAAAYFGLGLVAQFLIFAGVSVVLTVLSKTIFEDYYPHRDEEKKHGIDTLPGKIGTVTTPSKGALHAARVNVFGSSWKAYPENEDTSFSEGDRVEVVRVEGSSIYVKPANKNSEKALPDWRGDG